MKQLIIVTLVCVGLSSTAEAQVFINRDTPLSSAEVFGIRRVIPGGLFASKFGGMYVETTSSIDGKPFYGYAMDSAIKAYSYFDGANDGLHLYLAGIRQSIWADSI